ncbi:MAG: 3-phosphoshikimate 1-carboxyvinyltransferase, partial [Pseudomonadales bacterium]
VKETDRLSAMANELRALGATVIEAADAISITPPEKIRDAQISTYGDHRMAMCFSLASLSGAQIGIEDPDCVGKTFPDYFQQFERLAQR